MTFETSQTAYEGGLADPTFGSQAIFRNVMEAFAHPGRVIDLSGMVRVPSGLTEAAGAFLAALADYDTPVWFEKGAEDAAAWLAFHTGAPVIENVATAAFAILAAGSVVEEWSRFPAGTSSYPDRSATLLLPVDSLTDGPALQLAGPGIETTASIAPSGLPGGFVGAIAANRAKFPLGFDVVLVCGAQAVALPRTTRIEEN